MAADERRPVPASPPVQFTGPPAGHPACLAGMRADWIAFYDAEYHFVVRFVMRNGASLEDARDAAEEAFLDSWALMTRQPDRWSQVVNRRSWIRAVALRKRQRPRARAAVRCWPATPGFPTSRRPGWSPAS
jgi:DNA-directed RNA polymerase specialized sigma24 family protein